MATKIENKIDFLLKNATNLTLGNVFYHIYVYYIIIDKFNFFILGLDGWTSLAGHSIYNFIAITYDHQEFLYQLWDLSKFGRRD
jgi:hypothetical protein